MARGTTITVTANNINEYPLLKKKNSRKLSLEGTWPASFHSDLLLVCFLQTTNQNAMTEGQFRLFPLLNLQAI